jgi:molybdopterin-guanine dinucleotide biosynthesis protein A
MVRNFKLKIIEIEKIIEFDKNTFLNINTPSELILAQGIK